MANKGIVIVGAGIVVVAGLLLSKKAKAALPPYEPAEDEVVVGLLNPPSNSTKWQLTIYDWNQNSVESKFDIPIEDIAIFVIPPGTTFPLLVDLLTYHGDNIIDYKMQSVGTTFPFPPEWYVEAFINDFGTYPYNVSLEKFV